MANQEIDIQAKVLLPPGQVYCEPDMGLGGEVTLDELIGAAVPADPPCGVYFLMQDFEVVYVGESLNVFSRVAAHRAQSWKMEFDSYAWIAVPRDELLFTEAAYILKFRPKYNASMRKR